MAGLAYLYQGQVVSFDDEKYIDPQYGTARLKMIANGTHYHGFTSDVSASEYCPLKFNVSGTQARIASSTSRSHAFTDNEYTSKWSGTGYESYTTTIEKTYPAGTYYQGNVTSQTSEYLSTTNLNARSQGFTKVSHWEEPVATTTIMTSNPTASTKSTNTYSESSGTYAYGPRATYYTYTTSDYQSHYLAATGSTTSWRRSTMQYSSVKYGTDSVVVQASETRKTTCKNYTYSGFVDVQKDEWHETVTATVEILHNCNL